MLFWNQFLLWDEFCHVRFASGASFTWTFCGGGRFFSGVCHANRNIKSARVCLARNTICSLFPSLFLAKEPSKQRRHRNRDQCSADIPPIQRGFRGHPFKVLQGESQHLWRGSTFSMRVVKNLNKLPASIVTAPSFSIFQKRLAKVWTEVFPHLPH